MMSEANDTYSLVGVLCATDDAPGLCTPIFRNSEGQRYFIQSFRNRHQIDAFEFIGDQIGGHYVDVLSNTTFEVGREVQFGLVLPDRTSIVADLDYIRGFFSDNSSIFVPWPFMFYQLAITCRNQAAILDAFGLPLVREAIAKRRVPVVVPRSTRDGGKWTEYTSRILKFLWEFDFSSGEIARILGFSRNAVLSKAKRLGLATRPSNPQR